MSSKPVPEFTGMTRDDLMHALDHALTVIECYQMDCRNLPTYLAGGLFKDGKGFCAGLVYENVMPTIRRMLMDGYRVETTGSAIDRVLIGDFEEWKR